MEVPAADFLEEALQHAFCNEGDLLPKIRLEEVTRPAKGVVFRVYPQWPLHAGIPRDLAVFVRYHGEVVKLWVASEVEVDAMVGILSLSNEKVDGLKLPTSAYPGFRKLLSTEDALLKLEVVEFREGYWIREARKAWDEYGDPMDWQPTSVQDYTLETIL